jgi:membrane fusion protein, multidrug efflux system
MNPCPVRLGNRALSFAAGTHLSRARLKVRVRPVITWCCRNAGLWFVTAGCAIGVVSCRKGTEAPAGTRGPGVFVVEVVAVEPRPFRETLLATGSLLARESVNLAAERPGVVKEIRFEEGHAVRAGEVLVVLDDSELRAQWTRAAAQLKLAEAAEARNRELWQTGLLISEAEYEQATATLAVARAEKDLIEAQLAKTRVVAPFDGVAGLRQVSVGTYLTAGSPICSFQDLSSLRLDFTLPERYLGYLRTGQRVTFRVAGRAEVFEAALAAIEPSVDIGTRSLRVRALAANEGQRLLPGSFAEVEVMLDELEESILIPPIALIPGLRQQMVYVHRDGRAEQRVVRPGLRTADAVQVLEGLEPGDELITTGILQLRSGMRVEVRRVSGEENNASLGGKETGGDPAARAVPGDPAS